MTKSNPSVTGGRKSSGKQAIAKSPATPQQEIQAINENETRYRSLFSANTNALFLIGEDGHFLDANQTAVNWYGYSLEEFKKMTPANLAASSDLEEKAPGKVKRSLKGATHFEWRHRTKSGHELPVDIHTIPVTIDRKACTFAVVTDLSDQKNAEQALMESEAQLRSLFENSVIGMYRTTPEGRISMANPALIHMLGYKSFDELAKRDLSMGGYEPDYKRQEFRKLIEQDGEIHGLESTWKRKDGSVIFVRESAHLVKSKNGTSIYYEGTIEDISDRRKIEEELRWSSEHLTHMLTNSPAVIYELKVLGNKTTPAWISQNIEAVLGFTPEEAKDSSWWLDNIHPEDVPEAIESKSHLFDEFYQHEYRFTRKDGREIWLHDEHRLLRNEAGKPDEIVGAWIDITGRKLAESSLRDANERLSLAQRAAKAGTWDWDLLTGELNWSPEFFTLFGLDHKKDAATFDLWRKLLHPLDRQLAEDRINDAIQKKIPLENQYRIILPSGEIRWINSISNTQYSASGEALRMTGICFDITESKQAQKTLRLVSTRQEAILASDPNILMEVDQNKVYTWANKAGLDFFGQDVIGREAAFYFEEEQDTYEIVQPLFKGNEETIYLESWQRRRDGEKRLLAWHCKVLKDADGEVTGALSSAYDITEQRQAEKAIRQKEKRYRDLFENASLAIFQASLAGEVIDVNPEFARMFGYKSPEEFKQLVKNSNALFHTPGRRKEIIETRAEDTSINKFENVYLRKDGSTFIGQLTVKNILNEKGQIDHLEGFIEDISDRKQAEQQLQKTKALLTSILENAPMSIYSMTTDNRLTMVNHAWEVERHLNREQAIGRQQTELFPKELAERFQADTQRVVESRKPITTEASLTEADGRHDFYSVKFPIFDPAGNVEAVGGISLEITARKWAEEALRLNEARYRQAIMAAGAVPYYRDYRNSIHDYTFIGEGIQELTGYSAAEITPTIFDRLERECIMRGPLSHLTPNEAANLSREGKIQQWICDYRILTRDGQIRWLADAAIQVRDENNRRIGVIGILQDITERKRAEQEIQQLNVNLEKRVEERTQELHEAQEKLLRQEKLAMLGQLAGGVGHELRNPLSIILNAIYYLKLVLPQADEKTRQYFNMIEHEAHNAEKIVTDLLDFARTPSVEREEVALADLVQHVLERYPVPGNVEVSLKFPEKLPPVYVDPRQMEQVLGNLVVNACQAMAGAENKASKKDGGRLVINAWLVAGKGRRTVSGKSGSIAVSVKDTGTGIAPENMKNLFEPLFTTKLKGIGLGLAVSKRLIEVNGGSIQVESVPGQGSEFIIYLPGRENL